MPCLLIKSNKRILNNVKYYYLINTVYIHIIKCLRYIKMVTKYNT